MQGCVYEFLNKSDALLCSQEHRNRVFHDFRNGLCRNLVCTGKYFLDTLFFPGSPLLSLSISPSRICDKSSAHPYAISGISEVENELQLIPEISFCYLKLQNTCYWHSALSFKLVLEFACFLNIGMSYMYHVQNKLH